MPHIRADRVATLYVVCPLRRLARLVGNGIPILMYHSVSEMDEWSKRTYYRIGTNARVFREQLRFLCANRYQSVRLQEAVGVMNGIVKGPEKPVVLTFDDGYEDFYTEAFPILSRFGYSATVFLPTAYIGDVSRQFNGVRCLTWTQVRELRKAGVEFGSHTVTHPQLHDASAERIRWEVGRSKDDMQQKLGECVETFAYPYAFPEADRCFVQMLGRALQESGYRNGVTTVIGRLRPSTSPLFMSRLPINSHDDPRFFLAKLEGAYDWLRPVQYLSKLRAVGRDPLLKMAGSV